jgi:hypothetical protein
MLAGHFGLAAVVKARQPQIPAWSLMLSTQLLDVVFLVLYFLGIEGFSSVEGTNGGYGDTLINAPYTHSLVGAVVISLVATIVTWIFWGRRNAIIIGAVVFSHWLLDLIVHRPDMPILPGNAGDLPLLGFGLWAIPSLTAAVELGIVLAGAYLYYHAAMRNAVRLERQQQKSATGVSSYAAAASGAAVPAAVPAAGYRQNALVASLVMFVSLVATLLADVFLS